MNTLRPSSLVLLVLLSALALAACNATPDADDSTPTAVTSPTAVAPVATSSTSPTVVPTITMPAPVATETPPPTATTPNESAADIEVLQRREVAIPSGRIFSMSPDGQSFGVIEGNRMCVYGVDSLKRGPCAELKTGRMDTRSFAWSPDGTRLAFTEDIFRFFRESDIWVMDISSGELTNLTDDEVEGGMPKSQDARANLDYVPTWSPDGTEILFGRTPMERSGAEDRVRFASKTELYRIPADGSGEARKVLTLPGSQALGLWHSMQWLEDGRTIMYSVAYPQRDHPDNGLYIAPLDGGSPRKVLASSPDEGFPVLVGYSAQNGVALVYYPLLLAQYSPTRQDIYRLLDVETGKTQPVKAPSEQVGDYFGPFNVVLSPDGTKLLYTYRNRQSQFVLVARDVDGGPEKVLDKRSGTGAYGVFDVRQGLDWASNNTIYVSNEPTPGVLVTVGAK